MNPDIYESFYLRTLRRCTNHNSFGKYRMVAGIWKGRSFVGWGENLYRIRRGGETVHPLYEGKGLHAELDALTTYDTRRSILVVAGLSRMGYEINSTPCPRCTTLIKNSTLSKVVFYNGTSLVVVSPKDL